MTTTIRKGCDGLCRRWHLCSWFFAFAVLSWTRMYAIDAQVINGTSNINYYLYYDTDWVKVGTPVQVHVVSSIYGSGSFEYSGGYNRSWEGGDANYTLNPPAIWGYPIGGSTSYDQWFTIVPNEAGTFRIGIMVSSYPNLEQAHAYINFSAYLPAPGINSPTTVLANENQPIAYYITATNTPTGYSASGLPTGLSLDVTTGLISGRVKSTGTVSSTIGVSNSAGNDSKTVTWNITAAQVVARPSVGQTTVYVGDSITLTRDGTTNFELGWVESNVHKPDDTWDVFGHTGYGSVAYTPAVGPGTYWFTVRVVDQYENYNTQDVSFTVVNRPPPDVPSGLAGTATSSSTINLSWNASSGAVSYSVYRGGVPLTTVTTTSFPDSGLSANTTYGYSVSAANVQGISSSQSAVVNVTTAPVAPVGLSGTPNPSGSVTLSWSATAGAAGYAIYRNGTQYTTSGSASYVDSSTSVNTSFSYAVVAYNSANARSASSPTISVLTAPGVPTSLSGAATGPTSTALSWAASTGAASYVVYRNGTAVGTPTATNFAESGLAFTTTYNYSVAAKNTQGTVSSPCTAIAVTTMQNPPPPTPLNFTGSAVNSTHVTLNWNAAAGAAGYAIYRNNVQITTTTATTFTDQGLTAQTSYQYSVASYNPQGGQSARTSILTLTTPLPDPLGDDDGDGIPNGVEQALGADLGNPNGIDSGNSAQVKVNTPR